jgi:hypothetical protein
MARPKEAKDGKANHELIRLKLDTSKKTKEAATTVKMRAKAKCSR